MEKELIKTIHEEDLADYLKKLGVLELINGGAVKCKICGDIISLNNIHVLFPESGQIQFVCNKPLCVKEFNEYLREKKYSK